MMKIIKSLSMVLAVAAIAGYGTYAYFSDTEASNGNAFTAGSIDLSLGGDFSSENDVNGQNQVTLANPDQPGQALYNFTDLKPGDQGGGSFNLSVTSNEAYVCAKSTITGTPENVRNYPELNAGDSTTGNDEGELQNFLQLATFADLDGDGEYDTNEPVNVNQYGGDGDGFTMAEIAATGWVPVADPTSPNTWLTIGSLLNATPKSAGMLYCFGKFTTSGAAETTQVTGCNGADVNGNQNVAQTDGIVGGIEFYAVQTRNNPDFKCSSMNPAKIGANLGAYQSPDCSVTVQPGLSIQTALDSATNGQTVCLAAGNHNNDTYPLSMNIAGVSLAGLGNAGDAILNGGISINANNIAVKGLTIKSSNITGENFGIYLNAGTTNATVTYNKLIGSGSSVQNSSGLLNVTNSGVSGLLFANNYSTNWQRGIFLNPSANMTIEFNTLTGNAVGSANDNPTGNIIRKNHVTGNTAEGIGVFLGAGNSISVNQNNIFGNGPGVGDELNSYSAFAVNAENNWWGDLTPVDEIGQIGAPQVDFTPFAASAYPLN